MQWLCHSAAIVEDGMDGADGHFEQEGPSVLCEPSGLPPWSEEFSVPPSFGLRERRALTALGSSLPGPNEVGKRNSGPGSGGRKVAMPRQQQLAKAALRSGIPDAWKAFAWYQASGSAALAAHEAVTQAKDAADAPARLRGWYARSLAAAFGGEARAPENFADGSAGWAPLFGCEGGVIRGLDAMERTAGKSPLPTPPPLEEAWPHLAAALTPAGICAAKRVLWVLNYLWQEGAGLSPWVPPLVLAILIFVEEHDACAVLHCMLARASRGCPPAWKAANACAAEAAPLARAFLFCDCEGLIRASRQFVRLGLRCGGSVGRALVHLERLGVDVHGIAAHWLKDCLASLLSVRAFLRLTSALLYEGWKVPARYLLALLGQAEPALVRCADAAEATRLLLAPEKLGAPLLSGGAALDVLVASAFRLGLVSKRQPFGAKGANTCPTPYLEAAPVGLLTPCWPSPSVGEDPSLVDIAALVTLWSGMLPPLARLRRPRLVFSCSRDGYSLKTLARKCEEVTEAADGDVPMLFFVLTDVCGVLGGYAPLLWKTTGGGWAPRVPGVEDAFAFAMPPRSTSPPGNSPAGTLTMVPVACHRWTGANEMLLALSADGLLFGAGPAVFVNSELLRGSTAVCATFGSPPLLVPPPVQAATSLRALAAADVAAPDPMPGVAALSCCEDADAARDFTVKAIEVFALLDYGCE